MAIAINGNGTITGITAGGLPDASIEDADIAAVASGKLTGTIADARLPTVPVAKGGTGLTAAGASGRVLTSDGTNWASAAAAAGGVDGITSAANATAISIDSTERVTMPLQPSFSAYLTSNANGVVGGAATYHITNAFTEHFDIGGNFNAANGTFTAPVTGKYILATWIHVGGIDTAHSYYEAMFTTSNFQYRFDHNELDSGFAGTWYAKGTIVADMDASDTAYLTYRLSGSSTGTANISGGTTGVWFSGMLIG